MDSIKLFAVGDISLIWKKEPDPFKHIKPILMEKDILFGNLEAVLSVTGRRAEKAVLLNTNPNNIIYLKETGFDILNLANNHIFDLGVEGFNRTLDILYQNKIEFIGVVNNKYLNKYSIIKKGNIRLGFLGYSDCGLIDSKNNIMINKIEEENIEKDIKKIKESCDIVILSLHWGIEKVFYPSPNQIKLAHKLIDIGANIILGHHPHVLQGIEKYKSGIIAYSLGNFQFEFYPQECNGKDSKRTNQTVILSLSISNQGINDYDIIPVKINEDYCPISPDDNEKKEIIQFVSCISKPLTNGEINEKWWFGEISTEYVIGNYKSWMVGIRKYGFKHLLQFLKWLVGPFNMKCYFGFIRRKLKRSDKGIN
ncbi:MAG: CapA family protein [Actinobacteria bacterium]|nr:CapA family protein [Actinomycetota bacterium]